MKRIVGLDLGTTSIGWAVVEEDGTMVTLVQHGSRIVPLSPDDTTQFTQGNAISKNQDRTKKRTSRKSFDRYQLRRGKLSFWLKKLSMFPNDDLFKLPLIELWKLRADAASADKKLSLQEIGRVLYHMVQKRGYKHAKSDETNDDKKQKDYVSSINERFNKIVQLNNTIGQFFYNELIKNELVDENGKCFYTYRIKDQVFPRQAYEAEFIQIINCQKKYYPDVFTDDVVDELKDCIFYQRPLKSCKYLISLCDFEKKEFLNSKGNVVSDGPKVAPRTSPLFQICKIWESVNNISLRNRKGEELFISIEQKKAMFDFLNTHDKLTTKDLFSILDIDKKEGWFAGKAVGKGIQGNVTLLELRKALACLDNVDDLLRFDLEIVESGVVDAETGEILSVVSKNYQKQPLYKLWNLIYSIQDKETLKKALKKLFGIDDEAVLSNLYRLDFVKPGYGNKSSKFIRKILPYLQEGMMYSEACEYVGINHSNSLTKAENMARELLDKLPMIQKNELRQPIVEKILNQMINVVNEIIKKFGKIDEIRVELARELRQSKDERNETFKRNSQQDKENKAISERISKEYGLTPTLTRIRKYRMYEEANGICFYCGKPIELSNFLNGIDSEREHIIPKALLFDDSFSNQVCSCRSCNSAKSNTTAFDFMRHKSKAEFENYLERVKEAYEKGDNNKSKISKTKYEKLLTSYEDYLMRKEQGKETENDKRVWENFIDRQLRQSQYIAKKSVELLKQICYNVWTTSGSVTDFLRHIWGYDEILHEINLPRYRRADLTEMVTIDENGQKKEKEKIKGWSKRLDHRHHAIDAVTIAQTKQSVIQRLNTLNAERDAMFQDLEAQNDKIKDKHHLLEKWSMSLPHISVEDLKEKTKGVLVSFKSGKKVAVVGKRYVYYKGKKKVVQSGIIIPRGALHEEGVYGKITIKYKGGVESSEIVKKYVLGIGAQSCVFTGKETYEEKTKKGVTVIEDKIKKVLDSIVDAGIRKIILERLNRGFASGKSYKDDVKKALDNFRNLDTDPVYYNKEKGIVIKNVRMRTGLTAVVPSKYNDENEPISWVKPGNNHHIAIYEDKDGVLHEHIVTFWHAVERKKYHLPVIINDSDKLWEDLDVTKFPQSFIDNLPENGWKLKMSFQQNEMFVLGMSQEDFEYACDANDYNLINQYLYKVQNISASTYRFCLATDTHYDLKQANKPDKRYLNIVSFAALFNLSPRKVKVNILGEVIVN